ncbi:MAG: metal ABC transporter substrate-binding protein [Candidatus Saccharicenans sp.]|uniref:metal ABC transporter substrate-binding protein n=1 Tax=Candidatus Saccharicenans sp. TaxID=2819258 RepID=UPI004049EB3A
MALIRGGRFVSIFLTLALMLFSLQKAPAEPRLKVVTTILPLTDLARAVAGQRAEVRQLIPASAEIHHFQLRPSDLKLLTGADLLLAVGGGLEPWLDRLEKALSLDQKARSLKFLDFLRSEGFPAVRPDDLHIWLDLEADQHLVRALVREMSELDPEGTELYSERGQLLLSELKELDERYRRELSICRHQEIILAGHQAFAYLTARYGLTLISLTGPHPEAQPSARKLQEIINLMKEKQITAVFYESSQPPDFARTVARETGAELYNLSAGVNLTAAQVRAGKSFLDLMRDNLVVLKKALNCE